MPPCASSKRPFLRLTAPVNAPRSWPKSSDSNSVSGMAAQLILMKGCRARSELAWMACATSSLPVPPTLRGSARSPSYARPARSLRRPGASRRWSRSCSRTRTLPVRWARERRLRPRDDERSRSAGPRRRRRIGAGRVAPRSPRARTEDRGRARPCRDGSRSAATRGSGDLDATRPDRRAPREPSAPGAPWGRRSGGRSRPRDRRRRPRSGGETRRPRCREWPRSSSCAAADRPRRERIARSPGGASCGGSPRRTWRPSRNRAPRRPSRPLVRPAANWTGPPLRPAWRCLGARRNQYS